MREQGIDLQIVSERGTQLDWKETSAAADSVVILDKGAWLWLALEACFG